MTRNCSAGVCECVCVCVFVCERRVGGWAGGLVWVWEGGWVVLRVRACGCVRGVRVGLHVM